VIAVINPVIGTTDFTDILTEVLRGSTHGFLHITEPGRGTYEHVRNNRQAISVRIPEVFDGAISPRGETAQKQVVEFDSIDLDETDFRQSVDYIR
jgi:hypothetical protein